MEENIVSPIEDNTPRPVALPMPPHNSGYSRLPDDWNPQRANIGSAEANEEYLREIQILHARYWAEQEDFERTNQ